jgi:hypothetical protein
MRTTATLAMAILMIGVAHADDPPGTDSRSTVIEAVLQCTASEMTLQQVHTGMAASLTALTTGQQSNQQIASLITSYKALADDDHQRVQSYLDVITKVLIPQIAEQGQMSADDAHAHVSDVLQHLLVRDGLNQNNPFHTFDQQVASDQSLVAQSNRCDALAQAIHHGMDQANPSAPTAPKDE